MFAGDEVQTFHIDTPLIQSEPLTRILGRPVFLKMDALQPTGSFKLRGISYACQKYVAGGARHLVSSSGGNAGYAVAYVGRHLGVDVTVVVPETTPTEMRELIAAEGATVLIHGRVWVQAHAYALGLAYDTDAVLIHPYDDPLLWQGHSTLIDEVCTKMPKPAGVVLAVGGGGLLCGVAEGMRRCAWDDVPIIAVETAGAAKFARSCVAGQIVTLNAIDTVATSLATSRISRSAWDWAQQRPVFSHVVTDAQAIRACLLFADDHRVLVEPSCGATLAAAYFPESTPPCENPDAPLLVIVCGGVGVTRARLVQWEAELTGLDTFTVSTTA